MQLFYTPDITDDKAYTLNEGESKHAIRVLRLKKLDNINLVDGKGNFYEAIIVNDNPKKCKLEVRAKVYHPESEPKLHIAIAPTKNNDRLEWLIEKATEIGVSEITPLLCEQSERKTIKLERLNKRAVAAMKQSLKAHLPKINELTRLEEFIASCSAPLKFIAHCDETEKKHFKEELEPSKDCVILIGPEGDFSAKEIKSAENLNFKPVHLGKSRLRTETAGLYACTTFNLTNA